MMHVPLSAAVLVWLAAVPGFAAAQPMANMGPPAPAAPHRIPGAAFAPANGATQEYQSAMKKMMAGMDVPYTGNADHDFVVHMMPHHQGAVDMCMTEEQYGIDPSLKSLCRRIIAAQQKEILLMQSWLDRNSSVPPAPIKPSIQWK
jgi:uncharacterized protein (DUF305 family)